MEDGFASANVSSPAKISVGGGEAKTEPATAALRQPLPTYPEKAGSCPIQIIYQFNTIANYVLD